MSVMIAVAWIDEDGAAINKSRTEMRNGVLDYGMDVGLPVAKAVCFSKENTWQMRARATDFAREINDEGRQAVTMLLCKTLQEAKDAALLTWRREKSSKHPDANWINAFSPRMMSLQLHILAENGALAILPNGQTYRWNDRAGRWMP